MNANSSRERGANERNLNHCQSASSSPHSEESQPVFRVKTAILKQSLHASRKHQQNMRRVIHRISMANFKMFNLSHDGEEIAL